MLLDTVRVIEEFSHEGRTVWCTAGAYSRTPTSGRCTGRGSAGVDVDDAVRDVTAVLPGAQPNRAFRAALRRIQSAE